MLHCNCSIDLKAQRARRVRVGSRAPDVDGWIRSERSKLLDLLSCNAMLPAKKQHAHRSMFSKGIRMDESVKLESQLPSAMAFVEGGVQDVCDDACSICLESFCDSEPSTVTNCKHEFHLQCILEWCERSTQCPMCWQLVSFKDPSSHELPEAVERERSIRFNRTQNAANFHRPALRDSNLQHSPIGANDDELEERIFQHLAAAAAADMGTHRFASRGGHRIRSSAQGRPHFLVFSARPNTLTVGSFSSAERGENEPTPAVAVDNSSVTLTAAADGPAYQIPTQVDQVAVMPSGTRDSRIFVDQSNPDGQDRPGPSDFKAFSESLKTRVNAVSMRYKESIAKSTRGWRERLFSRNPYGTHSPHSVRGYSVARPSTARVADNSIGPLPDATVSSTACQATTNAN